MKRVNIKIYFFIILLLHFPLQVYGSVTVSPKFIFMDSAHKMVPISVRNQGNIGVEINIQIVYSYIITDDSGKVLLIRDSTATDLTSAARWIKPYPLRFVLGPGEAQTIRLLATPPPDILDGEYWGRVMVVINPRGSTPSDKEKKSITGGIVFASEIGLPIYYRHGKIDTDLDCKNFALMKIDNEITVAIDLEKMGNAAFNGSRLIRIRNSEGNTVRTYDAVTLVVFSAYKIREKIKVSDLPVGSYTLELEINSKRKDISDKYLIPIPIKRFSVKFDLP